MRRAAALLAVFAASTACGLEIPPEQPGVEAAAFDWSVDPCTDFYQFACGNWQRWHDIAADAAAEARRRDVQQDLLRLQYDLVWEDVTGEPHAGDPEAEKIGQYFRTCRRALESFNDQGEELRTHLQAITELASPAQLSAGMGQLRAAGISALFGVGVQTNPDMPTASQLVVGPGGFGMPRAYFVDPDKAAYRDAYAAHVDALVAALASPSLALLRNLTGALVLRIEGALAAAAPADELWLDPHAVHHPTAMAAFVASAPRFDWAGFFALAGVPMQPDIDVEWPPYLTAVDHLFSTTAPEDLRAYLAWRLIEGSAGALGAQFQQVEFEFHTKVFQGRASDFPAYWRCFLNTTNDLGFALSRPFVARVFDENRRAEAEGLLSSIRGGMKQLLAQTSWLDEATRAEALDKLTLVTPKVGFPDEWPSYDDFEPSDFSYLDTVRARRSKAWRNAIDDLSNPVDRGRWSAAPIVSNAFYGPTRNDITFPAAILQAPFFVPGRPASVNYGAMGSIMGHELTHAFDDSGRQYDGTGKLRDWWSPAVAQEFERRAACLVDQFDAAHPLPGTMVDGQRTLGENIADLGGIQVAYAAFHADEGGKGDGSPGFFTPDQQFFVAYAQSWCERDRPAYLQTLVQNDSHAPWKERVNGVVANVPAFAKAFRCPSGAPLAPVDRCAVW